jgi:hypothetical protein
MGSRAIGLVHRHHSKKAEFYGNGPQTHRNPSSMNFAIYGEEIAEIAI